MTVLNAADTRTFSPRSILWIILAGIFSFSAFVVLSAYAPDLRGGSDGGAHALSPSAVGYAGVVKLLRAAGEPVTISRKLSGDRDPAWSLLVLTPGVTADRDRLSDLAAQGPILIVAPKWEGTPQPLNPSWVDKAGLIPPKLIDDLFDGLNPHIKITRRTDTSAAWLNTPDGPRSTGPIDQLQTFENPSSLAPVLADARGGVVLAASPDRRILYLSDPDLLNTQGIASLATAQAAFSVIQDAREGDGPIAFDVSLNGFGAPRSLLKLAFSPPFLGASLCLLAAGILIGLHAANRFGPAIPSGRILAFGKRALADNSAGLIRMARREPQMALRYLNLTRAAVVEALGANRIAPDELDPFLDRLAERTGVAARLAVLIPEVRAVKTRAQLLRVAQSLHQWRLEMTREHR